MIRLTQLASTRRGFVLSLFLLPLAAVLGDSSTCRADERPSPAGPATEEAAAAVSPIARLRSWARAPLEKAKQREAVRMFAAVLEGSQMGPGDGWFGPGQSRYGWDWLARRYDADEDGIVTAEEFSGPPELFERLDRDHSGELKREDCDWSDNAPFVRQQMQAGQWFARIDKSSNGRISPEEWQQFFEKLAGEKGYVSRDDLRAGFFPPAPRSAAAPPPGSDGPSMEVLLKGLLSGELGSLREGPAIDGQAPDFELDTQDGKRTMRLSTFRDQKPVVLVFGSFT
jgi:EF hand domain-containing protein